VFLYGWQMALCCSFSFFLCWMFFFYQYHLLCQNNG
jgi:hypothetical protein